MTDGDGGFRDPDDLRRRAGVSGNSDRDQHFLIDDRVLDRLPSYLPADCNTTHLLEVGAGTGALTERLLATGQCVTAIERDPRLAEFLREEFDEQIAAGTFSLVEGDALRVDLPAFTASVSNLPYGISSEIAFRLFPFRRPMVLMFQAEFAERMVAPPGTPEYGRLSVSARHYAEIEIVERVPPEAFSPSPAVESAVVRTVPRDPEYDVSDESFFLEFVKALFTQRRKTVRNAIRNTAHISGLTTPEAVVAAAPEELLQRRPDDVDPSAFAQLATIARTHGVTKTDAGGDK